MFANNSLCMKNNTHKLISGISRRTDLEESYMSHLVQLPCSEAGYFMPNVSLTDVCSADFSLKTSKNKDSAISLASL